MLSSRNESVATTISGWVIVATSCVALLALGGCLLPSDPAPPERMVMARDESAVKVFEVGCSATRPLDRDVSIVIRVRTEPMFSRAGRFVLDGQLDDSGILVIRGADLEALTTAIRAAQDDEGLSFSGYEVLSSRRVRFEYTWAIGTVQAWLRSSDPDAVIYGSQLRSEVPADAAASPCRVVGS